MNEFINNNGKNKKKIKFTAGKWQVQTSMTSSSGSIEKLI